MNKNSKSKDRTKYVTNKQQQLQQQQQQQQKMESNTTHDLLPERDQRMWKD